MALSNNEEKNRNKKGQRMNHKQGIYEKYIKRVFDIICALLAIVVFCWLYVIIAVLVRVKLGSPVLFTQPRPGKDEKIFKLYKFRTMTDERDENRGAGAADERADPHHFHDQHGPVCHQGLRGGGAWLYGEAHFLCPV